MSELSHVAATLAKANRHHPALSASAILGSDRASVFNDAAEGVIHQAGMGALLADWLEDAEQVSLEALTQALGEMCRKDLALGLGYCLTAFMAATNLAVAGTSSQKQMMAQCLRNNQRIAIAYHELHAGNDLNAVAFKATPVEGGYLLSGCKEVVNNLSRASALVLFADTGDSNPARRHSLFLLDDALLAQSGVTVARRFDTLGVRNCRIMAIEFDEVFVPDECLLGEQGKAGEYALKAFQITRTLLPGISQYSLRNGLEMTTCFARNRALYGNNLFDIPVYRKELAEAASDTWVSGELATVWRQGLVAFPQYGNGYSAASKYFLPPLMKQSLKSLGSLIGARYYLSSDDYGLFEKLVRDFPVVSFGHAGSMVCHTTLVHQLPRLLAGRNLEPSDDILNRLSTGNSSWLNSLRIACGKSDPLLSLLPILVERAHRQFDGEPDWTALLAGLGVMKNQCVDLLKRDPYQAATLYCKVMAGIAILRNITLDDERQAGSLTVQHALGFIALWRLIYPAHAGADLASDPAGNTTYLNAADTVALYLQRHPIDPLAALMLPTASSDLHLQTV